MNALTNSWVRRIAGLVLASALVEPASAAPKAAHRNAPAPAAPAVQDQAGALPAAVRAWLSAHTDIAPETVLYATGDRVVALREISGREGPSDRSGELRVEFFTDTGAGFYGERSSASTVSINCPSRRLRTEVTDLFRESNRQGQFSQIVGRHEWVRGAPGSDTDAVITAACGPAESLPVQTAGTETPPVETEPAAPPRPDRPASRSARAPKAAAASPVRLRPSAPALGPVTVATAARARANVPASVSTAGSGFSAQLDSSTSRSEAATRAAAARNAYGGRRQGLEVVVESATVNGVAYHRTVVRGFATPGAASGFCAAVKATGRPCLPRSPGR